ncbi:MAG TPA: hypothetical protein VK188_10580, partial [Holophaga sp.]|nr:hypothetical protein [Holophaga sp.]
MRIPRPVHAFLAVALSSGTILAGVEGERLEIVGGSADDQAYARAAAGLLPGGLRPRGFDPDRALEAIRATDRFRAVEAEGGRIRLEPWAPLAELKWRGDAPPALRKAMTGLPRKGDRVGDLRMAELGNQAQERLRALGWPKAQVKVLREAGGARILVAVEAGAPD